MGLPYSAASTAALWLLVSWFMRLSNQGLLYQLLAMLRDWGAVGIMMKAKWGQAVDGQTCVKDQSYAIVMKKGRNDTEDLRVIKNGIAALKVGYSGIWSILFPAHWTSRAKQYRRSPCIDTCCNLDGRLYPSDGVNEGLNIGGSCNMYQVFRLAGMSWSRSDRSW